MWHGEVTHENTWACRMFTCSIIRIWLLGGCVTWSPGRFAKKNTLQKFMGTARFDNTLRAITYDTASWWCCNQSEQDIECVYIYIYKKYWIWQWYADIWYNMTSYTNYDYDSCLLLLFDMLFVRMIAVILWYETTFLSSEMPTCSSWGTPWPNLAEPIPVSPWCWFGSPGEKTVVKWPGEEWQIRLTDWSTNIYPVRRQKTAVQVEPCDIRFGWISFNPWFQVFLQGHGWWKRRCCCSYHPVSIFLFDPPSQHIEWPLMLYGLALAAWPQVIASNWTSSKAPVGSSVRADTDRPQADQWPKKA